ncbi:MAG TPA: hypothetical protein VJ873_01595 [bacterium]|nr:hypothetical protein [bacterium]
MKKEIQTELDSLLEARHWKTADAEKEKTDVEKTQNEFLERFNKVKRDVIKTAMVEIGERVRAKGIEYYLIEDATQTTAGEPVSGSIAIEFKVGNRPSFGVGCKKRTYDICFFYDPSSKYYVHQSSGPESSIKLADVTSDLIQKKILLVLKENLA